MKYLLAFFLVSQAGPALAGDMVQASVVIADGSIDTAKIAAGSINTDKLTTDAVTTAKIITSAVDTSKLATDSVIGSKILTGTIDTAKLNATLQAKIAGAAQLANSQSFTGLNTFNHSTTTTTIFKGYSSYAGSSANNGQSCWGGANNINGCLDYDSSNGYLRIYNTYNADAGRIAFLLRQSGSVVTPFYMDGAESKLYGSTLAVANTGIVSAPSQPGARAAQASSVVLANGTIQKMYFGNSTCASGCFDTNGVWGGSASSGTYTARGAGKYFVQCQQIFSGHAAATLLGVFVSDDISNTKVFASVEKAAGTTDTTVMGTPGDFVYLADGQAVQCNVRVSAGSITSIGGADATHFTVQKVW